MVDNWSAAFQTAFNGLVGSVVFWARVFNVGVWTDAAYRYAFTIGVDGDNRVGLIKYNAADTLFYIYYANASFQNYTESPVTDTTWMHMAITWNDAAGADRYTFYRNAVAVDGPASPVGTWAGSIVDNDTVIGDRDETQLRPWYGWLSHFAVFDVELTQPQIADLMVV
jgi:hypothetical protein